MFVNKEYFSDTDKMMQIVSSRATERGKMMLSGKMALWQALIVLILLALVSSATALTFEEAALLAQDQDTISRNIAARDDYISITRLDSTASGNVTDNDNGALNVRLEGSPVGSYGSLSISSDGSYYYVRFPGNSVIDNLAATDYVEDIFSYTITGTQGYESSARVVIKIYGNGYNPNIVALNDEFSLYRSEAQISGNVTTNDVGFSTVALLSQSVGQCGSLKFDSSGAFVFSARSALTTQCVDTFDYQITDQTGNSSQAQLKITVLVKNDDTSVDTTFYTINDQYSIVVRDSNPVTGNVTDNDAGFKSVMLVSYQSTEYGTLTFDSSGAFSYQLHSGVELETGVTKVDTFQYKIFNETGESRTGYLYINIVGKSRDDASISDFYAVDDVDNITRNVNASTSTISGNVLTNDSGYRTATLLSPVISSYGSLAFKSDGSYTYTLFNSVEEIQALDFNESLQDSFTYQIEHETGATTTATLKINIFGATGTVVDDVEIEPNNRSSQATTIITGDANKKKEIRGHLISGLDKDWYQITGKDEIIHLELCPPESSCYGENAWVLYVFDAALLTDAIENETVPFTLTGDKSGKLLATYDGGLDNNHMYLNYDFGNFGESLIGIIDPCYGKTTGVDIGVGNEEKTYYIAISSPLARNSEKDGPVDSCVGGSVLLRTSGPANYYDDDNDPDTADVEESTTQTGIVFFPNSDDQYILSVTRTGVNPLKDDSVPASRLGNAKQSLYVPAVRVNDTFYSLELGVNQGSSRSSDTQLKFTIEDYQKLRDDEVTTPYVSTFNPELNVLRIPKYIDESTQSLYSLILLYYPATSTSEPWLQLIDVEPLD